MGDDFLIDRPHPVSNAEARRMLWYVIVFGVEKPGGEPHELFLHREGYLIITKFGTAATDEAEAQFAHDNPDFHVLREFTVTMNMYERVLLVNNEGVPIEDYLGLPWKEYLKDDHEA